MAYEMNQQPTSYPYPPPAMAAPAVVAIPPRQKQFSKWWPISFFIAAFVMIVTGGGLIGAWSASATCSRSSSYYSSYYSSYSCSGSGMFYGGVACVAIGGVCKLIAWILLIVFCVKRSRNVQTSVSYNYQPISHQYAAPPAPAPAAPPYAPAAMQGAKVGGERYCAHCGATVSAAFCPQCGNKA